MSTVRITYEGSEPEGSVAAAAEVINAKLQVVAQLPVLVGVRQSVRLDDSGAYLVRGWLPSGQQLTATFDAGVDRTVILRAPRVDPEFEAQTESGHGLPGSTGHTRAWGVIWTQHAGRWAPVPTDWEDLGQEGARLTTPAVSSGSAIVQIGGALATRMTVIPATAAAHVSVQPDHESDPAGWQWRVDVPGDAGVMLLNYLENGDLRSATILANSSLETSAWTNATPFLAAAVGYVFLRTGDHEKLCRLIDRFSRDLDNVPDGAVIRAWRQLHEPDPDISLVQYSLKRAASGLPIASEGLRLLHHGLQLVTRQRPGDTDDGTSERIRLLAAAAALQPGPMTTFGGRAPWDPSMTPVVTNPAEIGQNSNYAVTFSISNTLRSPVGLVRWMSKSPATDEDTAIRKPVATGRRGDRDSPAQQRIVVDWEHLRDAALRMAEAASYMQESLIYEDFENNILTSLQTQSQDLYVQLLHVIDSQTEHETIAEVEYILRNAMDVMLDLEGEVKILMMISDGFRDEPKLIDRALLAEQWVKSRRKVINALRITAGLLGALVDAVDHLLPILPAARDADASEAG